MSHRFRNTIVISIGGTYFIQQFLIESTHNILAVAKLVSDKPGEIDIQNLFCRFLSKFFLFYGFFIRVLTHVRYVLLLLYESVAHLTVQLELRVHRIHVRGEHLPLEPLVTDETPAPGALTVLDVCPVQ